MVYVFSILATKERSIARGLTASFPCILVTLEISVPCRNRVLLHLAKKKKEAQIHILCINFYKQWQNCCTYNGQWNWTQLNTAIVVASTFFPHLITIEHRVGNCSDNRFHGKFLCTPCRYYTHCHLDTERQSKIEDFEVSLSQGNTWPVKLAVTSPAGKVRSPAVL